DFDLRRPDSWAARLSLAPAESIVGQLSFGHLASPETHHPGAMDRGTASLTHQLAFADNGRAATLLAFGFNRMHGTQVAGLAESTVDLDGANVVFARLEFVQKTGEDLVLDPPLDVGTYDVTSLVL